MNINNNEVCGVKDSLGIEYEIDCIVNSNQKIIIWGAGRYGRYIYRYLKRNGVNIYAVCDNRQDIDAPVPVVTLSKLNNMEQYLFVIAVARRKEKLEIKEQLFRYGIKPTQLVIPVPNTGSEFFDASLVAHRDFMYPAIAIRWNEIRRQGNHISDYFEQNDIYRIGVYEIKEFEEWLEEDLEWSKVSICQKITDEYSIDEGLDAIVVMDIERFDYIEEQIKNKVKYPVINIMEILK